MKPKKLKGAKKVPGQGFEGIEELEIKPMEGTIEIEPKKMEGAKKVKSEDVPKAEKVKSEDLLTIDLMMAEAKKGKKDMSDKEGVDAYTKEKGYYNFKQDKEESRKKYLEKLKKGKK